MKQLRSIGISLAAGLLGGSLAHHFTAQPVHAQSSAPKIIAAQEFVLQDESGRVAARMAIRARDGAGYMQLFDAQGRATFGRPFNLKGDASK